MTDGHSAAILDSLLGPADAAGGEVRAIFAMTANGATALGTSSHGIGNELDFALYNHARLWSDCVLAGAATVRNENYFGVRATADDRRVREARGQHPVPPIATVTGTLNLDPGSQFFTDTQVAPLILAEPEVVAGHPERRESLTAAGGEVVCTDTSPAGILATLRGLGHSRILIEGGPSVFEAFFGADLVDTAYLTVSPMVAPRGPHGGSGGFTPHDLELDHHHVTEDGYVFLRYRRVR